MEKEKYVPFILRGILDREAYKIWQVVAAIESLRPVKIIFLIRLQIEGADLRLIYEDNEKFEARLWQNQGGMSIIAIAVGLNADKDIRDLCGEHPNPWLCSDETIRYIFKSLEPKILDEDSLYQIIYNAMHSGKNAEEIQHLLGIVYKLIPKIFNR